MSVAPDSASNPMPEGVETPAGRSSTGRSGPRAFDSLTEIPRTLFEIGAFSATWGLLLSQSPRGQAHPIMVLPGFLAGDDSTFLLRRFLTQLRYKTFAWEQGTNTGNPAQLEALLLRFYRIQRAVGGKISLVGQSLGGVYAREIAKEFPDLVRCVITLGSPYGATGQGTTNPLVERLFERLSGVTVEELRAMRPDDRSARLPMPATSVFSKADGVVDWRTCIEPTSEISENIEIFGSHVGMAMNSAVVRIVADRLAQDPSAWSPYAGDVCGRPYPLDA